MPVEESRMTDGDSSDSVEYPSDDETSTYERRIIKLKRRRIRLFQSEFADGAALKASDLLPKRSPPPSPIKIRRSYGKRKRFSTPVVAFQPRKSSRLSTKSVDYEGLDEDFKEPPTYRRKSVGGGRRYAPRMRMDPRTVEFNPDALSGTIIYSSQKVYSQSGTTCHQCRQKTVDLKSRCYSPYCRGVRGMFCGYCLLRRYGEDVAVVLKDPNWKCPPCRKICNCSICRRSYGKAPTGILFPSACDKGYDNVLEYLAKLGDDKLEEFEANDESEEDEEKDEHEDKENNSQNINDKKRFHATLSENGTQPFVQLERLDVSFDEEGNVLTSFKGF